MYVCARATFNVEGVAPDPEAHAVVATHGEVQDALVVQTIAETT
jgi:hypothetical protein